MDTKKVLILIGILLIIVSAVSLIFGYRIREFWPTTTALYKIGIPSIIGSVGVTFFAIGGMFFTIHLARKKIIE